MFVSLQWIQSGRIHHLAMVERETAEALFDALKAVPNVHSLIMHKGLGIEKQAL